MPRSILPFAAVLAAAVAQEGVITTSLGPVKGIVLDEGIAFEGIPYAAPPVGPLRWQSPQPVAAWGPSVLDATQDPPGCMQICVDNEPSHICPVTVNEDCLYLNVWTPRMPNGLPTEPLPVLLFIHGGNFKDGYAGGLDAGDGIRGGLLYDGRSYANTTNSILVVINYRLGSMGFLYMGDEAGIAGNFGLQDQVFAMEWVQQHIASFGGDPKRLTLMGQSAGAMSISVHLSRPQTAGLYQGVIQHSNPFGEPWRTPANAIGLATAFANFSGCPQTNLSQAAACLRTKDSATLIAAQKQVEMDVLVDLDALLQIVVVWSPTIGTAYLPVRPLEAFVAGNVIDVPIMVGTTANETVIFVYEAVNFTLTQELYEIVGSILVGPEAFNESLAIYPYPTPLPADFRIFASRLLSDGLFVCATRNASEGLAVAQPHRQSPTFAFQYSHLLSWGAGAWGANFTECDNEVCHGSDLPLWFHPLERSLGANFTAEEDALALQMQSYWVNFARTGNPNGNDAKGAPLPQWPTYATATRTTIDFNTASQGGTTIQTGIRADQCKWWDARVGYHVY